MGWFSRKIKVQPPYDTLSVEQQRALYFLLEYFGQFATVDLWGIGINPIKSDAINYLKKATWYLGLTEKDIELLRPYHQGIENLYNTIKGIKNKSALDFMVNNCYNLVILSEGDNHKPAHDAFYNFWNSLGYSNDEIFTITRKYMYRTDI